MAWTLAASVAAVVCYSLILQCLATNRFDLLRTISVTAVEFLQRAFEALATIPLAYFV